MIEFSSLLHPLLDQSRTVYFSYHVPSGRVEYVNPAYKHLAGGDTARVNEELPQWLDNLHPDDREYLYEQFPLLLAGQLIEDLELRVRHASGKRQWLCLTACRASETDGETRIVGTIREVTKQKEYQENADNYNAKKNATLEILAHDLSGPLVIVQQLAEHVAEQSSAYGDQALNELVRLMRVTCQESVDLIRDFVDQEFMESAHVQLKRHRVNLVEKLQVLLENYRQNEKSLNKHINFHPASDPIYVSIDENKFQQVMNNLLSNAIKFTHEGGHIDIAVAEHTNNVRITVADDGIGIPEKLQPMLFEKFTRARRPGLRGEKATGLGMSVIRTIVGLHEGHIWFESNENQGSTFFIELPLPADVHEEN
jgi:two-component system sensor histidine kinase VicK